MNSAWWWQCDADDVADDDDAVDVPFHYRPATFSSPERNVNKFVGTKAPKLPQSLPHKVLPTYTRLLFAQLANTGEGHYLHFVYVALSSSSAPIRHPTNQPTNVTSAATVVWVDRTVIHGL